MKKFKLFARDKRISSTKLDSYMNFVNPTIIEERKMNVTCLDVFSRLLMDRIIFLGGPIDTEVANIIQAQLLYLTSEDSDSPISIYLNTPGGDVAAGLGIYDTMNFITPAVNTVCIGEAASMGAILLCAGKERSILKHSRVMIHQPSGFASGMASDILIEAKEIEKSRKDLCDILQFHTGQPYSKLFSDMERDYWMSAEEALEYNIVDKIL